MSSSKLEDGARIAHVSAVEVGDRIARREPGLREHDPQQRPVLCGGTSPEVVCGSGDEVPALLPETAALGPVVTSGPDSAFTSSGTSINSKTGAITRHLKEMEPGDGGAAVLDAVRYAIDLLEEQPQERRRILLLISESRDHGSKKNEEKDLVERIGTSNTLVLALTYSASGAE